MRSFYKPQPTLLGMPVEIRLCIFAILFAQLTVIQLHSRGRRLQFSFAKPLAILATCKTLRDEAAPFFASCPIDLVIMDLTHAPLRVPRSILPQVCSIDSQMLFPSPLYGFTSFISVLFPGLRSVVCHEQLDIFIDAYSPDANSLFEVIRSGNRQIEYNVVAINELYKSQFFALIMLAQAISSHDITWEAPFSIYVSAQHSGQLPRAARATGVRISKSLVSYFAYF